MLRIEVETKLRQEDVISRAVKYFGGFGMKISNQTPTSVSFEGGGGGIEIGTSADEKTTKVEFVTTEWENQVKEFIQTLKGKTPGKKSG